MVMPTKEEERMSTYIHTYIHGSGKLLVQAFSCRAEEYLLYSALYRIFINFKGGLALTCLQDIWVEITTAMVSPWLLYIYISRLLVVCFICQTHVAVYIYSSRMIYSIATHFKGLISLIRYLVCRVCCACLPFLITIIYIAAHSIMAMATRQWMGDADH